MAAGWGALGGFAPHIATAPLLALAAPGAARGDLVVIPGEDAL
ncbi:MAG: hypothetical protein ACE5IA_03030 [Dehalococcoidia bacterium]